jgi:hypothetical protein
MEIKISKEELSKKKLFLATPMYGGQCSGMFSRSVADLATLCLKYGVELKMYYLFNESLITRARNYCCDEFMRSGSTHLMFIDSDIGFNPNDVIAMLAICSDDSPYDVIGGPYPKKAISWEKIKQAVDKGAADENANNLENFVGDYVFNPVGGQSSIPLGEPVQVSEAGTGFMMIPRRTFELFDAHYPQQSYRPDHVRTEHFDGSREIMAYFDCIIDRGYTFSDAHRLMAELVDASEKDTKKIKDLKELANHMLSNEQHASKRYLSEDYNFCYLIRKIGGKVWFCPWMQLQHVGSYVFGGSLAHIAQVGAAATADISKLGKAKKLERPKPKSVSKVAKKEKT